MNIHIHTFGCKLNINESEKIKSSLMSIGYTFTSIDKADCFILNTCTVTKESDEKIEKYILKIRDDLGISKKSPIFLIGCYVSKTSYFNTDKYNIIITNSDKDNAPTIIDTYLKKNYDIKNSTSTFKNCNKDVNDKSRYFLKIQDGCNVFCSYCIVAFVRGKPRSISPNIITNDINNAVSMGYREIVFTGINIASYNYDGLDLSSLIKNYIFDILVKNNMRLRLSSIEPFLFTDKLVELFKNKYICPHIHIPLQSASDKILQLMNRRYTKSEYKSIIDKIRCINKNIMITTDIMVGFPEETEDDFLETLNFAKEIKFSKIHIFRYSKREGTKAYSHKNQIGQRAKIKRAKLLNELNTEMTEYYKNKFAAKDIEVIIEKKISANEYFGTSGGYLKVKIINAPDTLSKKMLILGEGFIDKQKSLIVKYKKIL